LDPSEASHLAFGLVTYVVFLFSTVVHEASHALAAQLGGDDTAARGGQVSLDPLPHIQREPFGMVVVPLLSFLGGGGMVGWASAPYDPAWAYRYPRRAALMALAGPVANLLLALGSLALLRAGLTHGWFARDLTQVLRVAVTLNTLLFVFNMLPVPPMDGATAIGLLVSDDAARRYNDWVRQPMMGTVGLVIAWGVFPKVAGPLLGTILDAMNQLLWFL
jgi:Zn-dependent protease